MKTFHIHIKGIVQGVGFRPFVYKLATEMQLKGWVNNTSDGVHIRVTTDEEQANTFFDRILAEKPKFSVITSSELKEIIFEEFNQFDIIRSEESGEMNLLVTPDFAMCQDCQKELYDETNPRYLYPFITCTNCGPRYSIIKSLPYDRPTTTMAPFKMCPICQAEYDDPLDRRYYSQTNSCPKCAIELSLWENGQFLPKGDEIQQVVRAWRDGKIVAIKGVGGYLLTCDATNSLVIRRLRKLKQRPSKPLAMMHPDLFELAEDVEIDASTMLELEGVSSPIVLLSLVKADDRVSNTAYDDIAPGLKQVGVMLPYTPLYELLLQEFGLPVVATSGNISGSTIIFRDAQAVEHLSQIADLILLNNRKIVLAQDDSVLKYSVVKYQKIILRRSRGLAPSFLFEQVDSLPQKTILSLGAMLKSTFTLFHAGNVFVSQYLGSTDVLDAQENYERTLEHLLNMFDAAPEVVIVDKHPQYYTHELGRQIAKRFGAKLLEVQHHKAHFYAVLGEHNLMNLDEKVLGVIWDGTGYGDDGQIWGGEFFIYEYGRVERIHHLDYFDFILGDKMPREPRISAFVISGGDEALKDKFTDEEWRIYQKLLAQDQKLQSSSAGRLFDAAASIILDVDHQTYEGEAAMRLESAAYQYFRKNGATKFYTYLTDGIPTNFPNFILKKLIEGKVDGYDSTFLAAKFHITLANYIYEIAKRQQIRKVAFSGGVFQNGWLVDLVQMFMDKEFELYFHKNLSPNDEGISFGQLMSLRQLTK